MPVPHGQRSRNEWRQWLPTLHPQIKLHDPASQQSIKDVESALSATFHDELRSLLLATDGVVGPFGYWLVWPASQIQTENHQMRTMPDIKDLFMPFDHLLFIGEVGNGDLFAYPIMADGNARYRNDIFRWDHETDNRVEIAASLSQYLKGFTDGSIEA